MPTRTLIDGHLDVETPNGDAFRIHVIKGVKGLGIVPIAKGATREPTSSRRGPRSAGRAPRPGTLAVRRQMAADSESGSLQSSEIYAALLRSVEATATKASARQRVYREKRRLLEEQPGLKAKKRTTKSDRPQGRTRRGRKPAASTLALRERLAADAATRGVKATRAYADFLIQRGLTESTAR